MLSFDKIDNHNIKKTIVAVVDGGKNDCRVLFLYDKEMNNTNNKNTDFIHEMYNINSKKNKITVSEIQQLKYSLQNNIKPEQESLNNKYEEVKEKYNNIKNDIILQSGKFIPMPDLNKERCIWSFNGSSGSGKSFLASLIVNEYQALFPENPVLLFSRCSEDPAFDDFPNGKKIIRIDIDENIESNDFINLHDCLIIFDDIDTLPKITIEPDSENMLKKKQLLIYQKRYNKLEMIF